jgi:hypothetical protein
MNLFRTTAVEFTRPANATQYAAGDVIGPATTAAVITFSNLPLGANGRATVRWAQVVKSDNDATTATIGLFLYRTAPTAIADNSPWTLLYADALIGYIALDTVVSGGSGSDANIITHATEPRLPLIMTGNALYGVLVALGTYTPASGEKFRTTLGLELR